MKLKLSACIEAPKDKVWETLSDITNVNLWVDPILSAHCKSDQQTGIGTVRVCRLKGNMTVTEKWIEWIEGDSYTYQANGMPLIKSAKNKWTVDTVNGKSLLTTESEVHMKSGLLALLLVPIMYFASRRMGSDSLAAIKHLIETGQPYQGKFSKLPRVPVIC